MQIKLFSVFSVHKIIVFCGVVLGSKVLLL